MRLCPSVLKNREGRLLLLLPKIPLALLARLMGHRHIRSTSTMMELPEACQRNLLATTQNCKTKQLRQREIRTTTTSRINRERRGSPRAWLKELAISPKLWTTTTKSLDLQSDGDPLRRVVPPRIAHWRTARHNFRPNTGRLPTPLGHERHSIKSQRRLSLAAVPVPVAEYQEWAFTGFLKCTTVGNEKTYDLEFKLPSISEHFTSRYTRRCWRVLARRQARLQNLARLVHAHCRP